MIRYVFRDRPLALKGGRKADPQKIGEALAKIRKRTKGRCNSKSVLDAARDQSNYLNRFFDWEDSVAGEKWRQEQARQLVSSIDIVETHKGKERALPAFVSINQRGGHSYHPIGEVLGSAELQIIALRQAEADFESYSKRLMRFADIANAIRAVRDLIAKRRAEYEAARPQA
jgi:hypothetical protein